MKKMWVFSCIVIVVIITIMYSYHRPHPIEVSLSSIIYSNDSDFEKTTMVTLKGDLYKSLIGNGIVKGELSTDEDLTYKVTLKQESNTYSGFLYEWDSNKNIRSIGSIMATKELDKIWLQLDEINERYSLTEGYIAGPAHTIKEAKEVASLTLLGKP